MNREGMRAAIVVALLLFCSGVFYGQSNDKPTIQGAFAELRQQNYDKAIEILQSLTEQQPENAFAWYYLGFARQSNKDPERALAAYEKARTFPQTKGNSLFSMGVLQAQEGNLDEAFELLFLARDSANVDVTSIGTNSNIDSLKADERYGSLFPSPEAYADPFVEQVKIIHDWHGEAEGDQFGWIARNIGDVDGDGVDDVTTSAPTSNEAGQTAGKVYAYSGRSGELLWSATGNDKAQLGLGIEAAGDVNADGIPDVLAGAPGEDKTYVLSGKDGEIVLTLEGEKSGDFFGRKVSDIGDWNGDGHDDVLIGAPRSDVSAENAGSAYVYSGKDGKLLITWRGEKDGDTFGSSAAGMKSAEHGFLVIGVPGAGPQNTGRTYVYNELQQEPFFVIEADSTGAALGGMFVSVLGDVDGDGIPDVYASDWSNSALGRSTGRIYVHSGADGERLFTLTGEAAGDGFGIGPADAGDVDGDGHADLIVGAWQHGSAAPSGGKCYLYSGASGDLLKTYTCKVPGETFGFDATGMGDVDGDGSVDLLLTSGWSAIKGSRSGRMFIISSGVKKMADGSH